MRTTSFFLALALATAMRGQPGPSEVADTIFHNGKIVTLWSERPVGQAAAIRNGRFLAVGSDDEIRRYAGPSTRQIDLRGRCRRGKPKLWRERKSVRKEAPDGEVSEKWPREEAVRVAPLLRTARTGGLGAARGSRGRDRTDRTLTVDAGGRMGVH